MMKLDNIVIFKLKNNNSYESLNSTFHEYNFNLIQQGVWIADSSMTTVEVIMAIKNIQERYPEFKDEISHIKLVQSLYIDDLIPVL